jgi:preprotein translocase subunit SecD
MRRLTAPLFLLLLLLLNGCQKSAPPTPLTFYTLSATKLEGGQFLDTEHYPKLGYIAATPELSLTHLESVAPQTTSPEGSKASVIQVRLTPDDTKKLAGFTQRALHKTIVIRLGETILMAPKVNDAITSPNLGISLREGPNTQTIEAGLKKLAE